MCDIEDENQKASTLIFVEFISNSFQLNEYFYKFTDADTSATYLKQSEELQCSDTNSSNPGPSKAPCTPVRTKSSHEEVSSRRKIPMILLKWAETVVIFQNMVLKEQASSRLRDPKLFVNQSTLLPTMRLIVLDWLMEICKTFKYRRRVYHLAVDYIDRYLSINVAKVSIEEYKIIGVTCLFIAIKLEERDPPELSSLPSTPDKALTHDKIRACEEIILKSLNWDIDHITPDCWLNLYLQTYAKLKEYLNKNIQQIDRNFTWDFIYPIYSAYDFVRCSQIIDLFSMDPAYLQYPYNVIAAAAVYFRYGKNIALFVSGLPWEHMENCVEYMSVFCQVIRDSVDPKLKSMISLKGPANYTPYSTIQPNCGALKANIPNLLTTDEHWFQTHCIDMEVYVEATRLYMGQFKTKRKRPAAAQTQHTAKKTTEEEVTKVMLDVKKQNTEKVPMSLPVTATTIEEEDKENQAPA